MSESICPERGADGGETRPPLPQLEVPGAVVNVSLVNDPGWVVVVVAPGVVVVVAAAVVDVVAPDVVVVVAGDVVEVVAPEVVVVVDPMVVVVVPPATVVVVVPGDGHDPLRGSQVRKR